MSSAGPVRTLDFKSVADVLGAKPIEPVRSVLWSSPLEDMPWDKGAHFPGEAYDFWPMDPHMPLRARASILVVDDDAGTFDLFEDTFGSTYNVSGTRDGETAVELASRDLPDVILLDASMPGMDGFAACERLKAEHRTRHIPILMMTDAGDAAAEAKALDVGAVDHISKPLNPASLRARVGNHISMKTAQDQLRRIALTDALTGLANRSCFDAMLEREHARHARSGTELSLLVLDLDHFKRFNEAYGYAQGDDCLRHVASAIAGAVVRTTDLAARFGGEEFAVLLPETDKAGGVIMAQKIRERIKGLSLPGGISDTGCVTASVGVATVRPRPGRSSDSLIVEADRQLYDAKAAGRDRVCAARVNYDLP